MKSTAPLEERFAEFTEACVCYWVTCGLPGRSIEMLRCEMAPSVAAAVERGKEPEEVFGPVEKWAKSLREAHREGPRPVGLRKLRLSGFAFYLLLVGTGTAGLLHIRERSFSFALDAGMVGLVVLLTLLVSVSLSPTLNLPGIRLFGQRLRMQGAYLLFPGSLLLWALHDPVFGFQGFDLMQWSPVHSAGLLALAVAAGAVHFRWDRSRGGKGDPAVVDPARSVSPLTRRARSENALALRLSFLSLLSMGLACALLPSEVRGEAAAVLAACLCWTLYLLTRTEKNSTHRG